MFIFGYSLLVIPIKESEGYVFLFIFSLPFIFFYGIYGLGTGTLLRHRKWGPAALMIIVAVYWFGEAFLAQVQAKKEWPILVNVVSNDASVAQAAGHVRRVDPEGAYEDRLNLPKKYQVMVVGDRILNVLVDVTRSWTSVHFTVVCVVEERPSGEVSKAENCEL